LLLNGKLEVWDKFMGGEVDDYLDFVRVLLIMHDCALDGEEGRFEDQ
jgi:hypothetical protein